MKRNHAFAEAAKISPENGVIQWFPFSPGEFRFQEVDDNLRCSFPSPENFWRRERGPDVIGFIAVATDD